MEAEGCFKIRETGKKSYSISQENEKHIIEAIREYFRVENVVRFKEKPEKYTLEIYSRAKLEAIREHLRKYPLLGEKHESYLKFYK